MSSLIIISVLIFSLMIGFGFVCQFIGYHNFYLIPIYLLCLLILQFKKYPSDCIALKMEDYFYTFIITVILIIINDFFKVDQSFHSSTYIYLSVFLSYINYACSMRFRSMF